MKILSTSSVIDNIPTCGNQEDYVAMGYNSSKKAIEISEKLEYILAIELLSAYQSYQFVNEDLKKSTITSIIYNEISEVVPIFEEDTFLYEYIEFLKKYIHDGKIVEKIYNLYWGD